MRVPADRILIVLLGAIGDVVRALPLANRLRAGYPRAHIAWAVEPRAAPILAGHPALDDVLVFERRGGVRALARFLRRVRQQRFDLTLDLQRHAKSGLVSFASRAPVRIGFHRRNAKELNWLWNTHTIEPVEPRGWKLEQYLRFATLLELPDSSTSFDIRLSADEEARTATLLASLRRPFAALFLGSTWESRLWFAEGFATVADELDRLGLDTVLLGGDDVTGIAAEARRLARVAPLDLTAKTTLRESYGILARARGRRRPRLGADAPRGRGGHAGRLALGGDDAGALGSLWLGGSGARRPSAVRAVLSAPLPDRPAVHAGHHTGARARADHPRGRVTAVTRAVRVGRWRVWLAEAGEVAGAGAARAWIARVETADVAGEALHRSKHATTYRLTVDAADVYVKIYRRYRLATALKDLARRSKARHLFAISEELRAARFHVPRVIAAAEDRRGPWVRGSWVVTAALSGAPLAAHAVALAGEIGHGDRAAAPGAARETRAPRGPRRGGGATPQRRLRRR